ncbi:hypothetical protein NNJEOMEG_01935 [Fundidesulfovibrio magnetotacticus]|uniref:Uncharacterized protein n=1 Tax=Fundidesulfovibrio magnetotacticus TaxID=2730080 RepID=A0A6V8LWA9_9BACT|nr:hypothetical protein [Fundidesulfovibrio magnetotacticus]GFK94096.1 hypothetical protein NNJEOMEG_01935 [Fundidesulfovibrio magnetotacticus]
MIRALATAGAVWAMGAVFVLEPRQIAILAVLTGAMAWILDNAARRR